MKGKDRRLAEIKTLIPEVSPEEALAAHKQGAVLLDVREADEVANGSPKGALRLNRGFLELRIEDKVPDVEQSILVMCAGGVRSLFAAEALKQLGYQNVKSVAGGFNRWKNNGLTFELPRVLDDDARERYARHLQRQILHTDARVDTPKVASAREALESLNPRVKVVGYQTRLDSSNVEEILSGYDVVVDGSDNLPTRYLINDACVKLGIPNVHAAIYRFEGQITVFWPGYEKHRGGCYRCMFPEPPPAELAPSCSEIGVLGVLPGVLGVLQAGETVKVLLKLGDPLVGRMLYYDALRSSFSEFKLKRNPQCKVCGDEAKFAGYSDYAEVCASPAA